MVERLAIRWLTEVLCDCPINNVCQADDLADGQVRRCGHCKDIVRDELGTRVFCALDEQQEG